VLRFTKRADYGLMAIHYIARHQESGSVSAKRIADEFGIPAELLAKILQRLAKRKLIASHNGPKGGTVGRVVRALEGPISIVNCLETHTCAQLSRRTLRRPVLKIQAGIAHLLDTMTLAELLGDEVPEPVLLTIN
jgi:Rrf2 family protein